MITWNRAPAILALLFAITAAAPGYAVAQPPADAPELKWAEVTYDAVLYETTENLSIRALQRGRRKAVSSLFGFARPGSALCPDALLAVLQMPQVPYCTLNATGSDNISLVSGLGTFGGDVEVVIQEVVDLETGQFTPDSPEVVIAKGRFIGKMDFAPAIVGVQGMKMPYGTVDGFLSLDGFSRRVPFKGVFRLPFLIPPVAGDVPQYLLDPQTFAFGPVQPYEMAIGYPAVRFEITF